MMGSSAWTGQDHPIHPGHEDDFQQFLDMGGMGNLPEGINFDFHDFQNANAGHMAMQAPPRDHLDTAMSGTETPVVMSRPGAALQHQMPSMTSAQPYQSIPTGMIPPQTPNEALVNNIDAQIHYLQQQKMEHQRVMEEQQAFFARQQQNRIVPPTPQSLELQAGNQQYYPQPTMGEQTPQHQAVDYRFQRLKDQQEVRTGRDSPHPCSMLTPSLDVIYAACISCCDTPRLALPRRYPVHRSRSLLQPPDVARAARPERLAGEFRTEARRSEHELARRDGPRDAGAGAELGPG